MNKLVQQAPKRATASLAPQSMAEAMRFADMLASSAMVPRDFVGKPGNVLVCVQWGAELGLGPMQALQNIAVIGGRPALWGDAVLALVRAHPQYAGLTEGVEGTGDDAFGWCEVKRQMKHGVEVVRQEFSVADARRAKLWGKQGPWSDYPQRMLKMRARGWAIRDLFADALRGLQLVEEVQDIPAEPREVPNLAEPERGPVRAAPGSMAEHGARVAGREVEHPPEPEPEEALPLVYLDGRLVGIGRGVKSGAPAVAIWRQAALLQVAKAESWDALRLWRQDNGTNFGEVAALHPAEVREVEAAIDARLAALQADAAGEAAPEAATA